MNNSNPTNLDWLGGGSSEKKDDNQSFTVGLLADLHMGNDHHSVEPFQLAQSFPPPQFQLDGRNDNFSRMLFMPPPQNGLPSSGFDYPLPGGPPFRDNYSDSRLLPPMGMHGAPPHLGLQGPPVGLQPQPVGQFQQPLFPHHQPPPGGNWGPLGSLGPPPGAFPPPPLVNNGHSLSALLSDSFKDSTESFIQSSLQEPGKAPTPPLLSEPSVEVESGPSKLVVVPQTSAVTDQKSKQLLNMLKVRTNASANPNAKSPFQTASHTPTTPKGSSNALKAALGVSPTSGAAPSTPTEVSPTPGKSVALKSMLGISKPVPVPIPEAAPVKPPALLAVPPGIAPPPGFNPAPPTSFPMAPPSSHMMPPMPALTPSKQMPPMHPVTSVLPPTIPSTPASTVKPPADTPTQSTAKKVILFRSTKQKVGSLVTTAKGNNDEVVCKHGHRTRPATYMIVTWTLPIAFVEERMSGGKSDLVIGLVRYGSYTNAPCIVMKSLDLKAAVKGMDKNNVPSLRGKIQFHTPKAAGQFVYRLFDHSTKENDYITLCTSEMFHVDIFEYEIITNIRFILDMFRDETQVLKAVQQLPIILRGIRLNGLERHPSGNRLVREISDVLVKCLHQVLQLIEIKSALLDDGFIKKQAKKLDKMLNSSGIDSNKNSFDETHLANLIQNVAIGEERTGNAEDDKFWSEFKTATRIHSEAHDVLDAMMSTRGYLWQPLIPPAMAEYLHRMDQCFCPLLQRFFPNVNQMQIQRLDEFGFAPALKLRSNSAAIDEPVYRQLHRNDIMIVNESIQKLLPQLLPKSNFYQSRESFRAQIQASLLSSCGDVLPASTEVVLYGSSLNNFGSEGSDMDMCLILPPGTAPTTSEDKVKLIERLGEALTAMGMKDVSTRSTARIPIVQFKDEVHGVECDIALSNPLARSNTLLLRAYSHCDPRVRELAYVIKHWAKARCLNSPGDGTLSSYGFILCLLHFLQTRPIPLVPNLQKIPLNWQGRSSCGGGLTPSGPLERLEANSDGDNTLYNTYFYSPNTEQQARLLQVFARNNSESTAELLVEFFRYFVWCFDHRTNVVSIRTNHDESKPSEEFVSKLDKAESDAWSQHDRLSVEDPFETWYDVAHVIKAQQMSYFRKELLRAYTLASRISSVPLKSSEPDALPSSVLPSEFVAVLCEKCDDPPFSAAYKERVEKLQF